MIEPFVISVDDGPLRARLRQTRWPDLPPDETGAYGVRQGALRALVAYWLEEFDWGKIQAEMNRHAHYRVSIDGQPIHFLHIRSPQPNATPLILTHGWPWTFWDMRRVFALLTDPENHGGEKADAFDLIVPSLPGFGFSIPVAGTGGNFWRTADLWHRLMTEVVGVERYGAAGGDWGAFVSAQLGHKYPEHVIAVHMTQAPRLDMFDTEHPWRPWTSASSSTRSPELLQFERRFASHMAVHMIEPDTLSAALHDSPVGMLAWLLQRWNSWSGSEKSGRSALPRDQMLANATLYWTTGSLPSSLRFYANASLDPWRPTHDRVLLVETPTGFTLLAGDLPEGADLQRLASGFRHGDRGSQYNIVHTGVHEKGGHFAHFENPEAVVADIRATFRAARR